MTAPRPAWVRPTLIGSAIVLVLLAAVVVEVRLTASVRGAVRAYTALISAANQGDLQSVRDLCSTRYLRRHHPTLAAEGGVVGLPRTIHKNFRAWRHGSYVWICPTNRVGPIYQFVPERGLWRFDGPIGLLQPGNQVLLNPDLFSSPE